MRVGNITGGGWMNQTATSYAKIASGTTAHRPASPSEGMMRYNTTLDGLEYYSNGVWALVPVTSAIQRQLTGFGGATSEPMLFIPDSTRSNKYLSVETLVHTFAMNSINNDDWFLVNPQLTSTAGVPLPFTGTVVRVVGYAASTNSNHKRISVYINDTESTSALYMDGRSTSPLTVASVTNNIDFASGTRLRLRARSGGSGGNGNFQNVVVSVYTKWRYTGT